MLFWTVGNKKIQEGGIIRWRKMSSVFLCTTEHCSFSAQHEEILLLAILLPILYCAVLVLTGDSFLSLCALWELNYEGKIYFDAVYSISDNCFQEFASVLQNAKSMVFSCLLHHTHRTFYFELFYFVIKPMENTNSRFVILVDCCCL